MNIVTRALATLLGATAITVASLPAAAQWRVSSGENIRMGQGLVLLVAELDASASLYGQCLPSGDLSLYISVADNSSLPPLVTGVDIGTGIDGAAASWARGEQERQGGVLVTRWTDPAAARAVVDALVGANAEVAFSIYRPVVRVTDTWRVAARSATGGMGATGAALEFDRCRILREAAAQPQTPAPLAPPSELFPARPNTGSAPSQLPAAAPGWYFEAGAQPRLVARTPDDLDFVLHCTGPGQGTVSLESGDWDSFPVGLSSLAAFGFGIGDETYPLTLEPGPDRNGRATLITTNPQLFALTSMMLVAAADEPEVENMIIVVGAAVAGSTKKAAHIYMEGASEPVGRFFSACFG